VSGELVEVLKRRALTLRRLARHLGEEGEFDLAMVMAEQAAQLYIKSFFQEVIGYIPRIHGLRRLLSILAGRLEEAGYPDLGVKIRDFVARRRLELAVMEDAYVMGRYGPGGYTAEILDKALDALNELIGLIDGVRDELRRGRAYDKGVR